MIANITELNQTIAALGNLTRALVALRRDVTHDGNFKWMAEGFVNDIVKLSGEIQDFISVQTSDKTPEHQDPDRAR